MNQTEIESATTYKYRSDYGDVDCVVLGVGTDNVARIMLIDDYPPLGEQGDTSFVDCADLRERY